MSEIRREPSPHITPRRVMAGLAIAAVISGSIKYGPDLLDGADNLLTQVTSDPSLIVAGVPGQIESYQSKNVWTGKLFVRKYWLGIEQCPDGTENTKESFNPEVGQIGQECNYDWVKVNPNTYSTAVVGDSITFSGKVGEELRK